MDYCPPPPPKTELVFYTKQICNSVCCEHDEQHLTEVYDRYAKLIGPLNQAIFNIIIELKKYPENETTIEMVELLFAFREEVIEFLSLEQADRAMVPKGPWPPERSY